LLSGQVASLVSVVEAKLAGEQILADARAAEGLRVAMVALFQCRPVRTRTAIWQRHDPETHLIPLAIDAATGDGPPLSVFGTWSIALVREEEEGLQNFPSFSADC
jgi:UDP-glucose 4-epimerase